MAQWASGYVHEIEYTHGYYPELNPLRASLAFINANLKPPKMGVHCELGFGQGISINIHSVASPSQWYGTDFNPSHASFAKSLSEDICGGKTNLFDASFADFCAKDDLPDFDSIALHGIWSWINDTNKKIIVDFIERKLKVGGVLYISYNTNPGWAPMVPMRNLLSEYIARLTPSGEGMVGRIDKALEFADKLIDANTVFGRANPNTMEKIKRFKNQNRNYLAHEYFNQDWTPMSFSDMASWLLEAKLSFACSANYLDHIESINLTSEQQGLINSISDPIFRENVRDFCVNQQFRRDYWVKGAVKLNSSAQKRYIQDQWVVLVQNREDVSLKINGILGEAFMQEAIYNPILDALADNKPKTITQIEKIVGTKADLSQITQAVVSLIGSGALAPSNDPSKIDEIYQTTKKFNINIMEQSCLDGLVGYLASPVSGGGISIQRYQQILLLAISKGKKTPRELAVFAWEIFSSQGQYLIKDGKNLEGAEENIAELTSKAEHFIQNQLPLFKALMIV